MKSTRDFNGDLTYCEYDTSCGRMQKIKVCCYLNLILQHIFSNGLQLHCNTMVVHPTFNSQEVLLF